MTTSCVFPELCTSPGVLVVAGVPTTAWLLKCPQIAVASFWQHLVRCYIIQRGQVHCKDHSDPVKEFQTFIARSWIDFIMFMGCINDYISWRSDFVFSMRLYGIYHFSVETTIATGCRNCAKASCIPGVVIPEITILTNCDPSSRAARISWWATSVQNMYRSLHKATIKQIAII